LALFFSCSASWRRPDQSATTAGAVGAFFCDDYARFDTPGAVQIAGLVAQTLKDQGIPLAAYLE